MTRWTWVTATLLAIACPAMSAAQEQPTLVPVQVRIRLWVGPDELALVGNLAGLDRDTVVITHEPNGARVAVPLEWLQRLETSQGRHSHTGRGALYGFVLGATTTAGVVLLNCGLAEDSCSSSGGDWTGLAAAVLGLAGGLAGTGIGAVVGAMIRTERWQEIPVQRLRIGAARAGGVHVGLSYPFPSKRP
jgi:hypothetical protein